MVDGRLKELRLTPRGKRAETRLENLIGRRDRFVGRNGDQLTALTGAYIRDDLDNEIDRIEGRFADTSSYYWVQPHARRGTRGVRGHPHLYAHPSGTKRIERTFYRRR